jgi:branched-chain amino acid transport system ATP-binding protein
MSVLRIENLYCAFGNLVVTKDVNLTVETGERHVIIGPNGAGKTSLINQIGGQLHGKSGRILLDETDITRWPPNRIAQSGVARTFQRNNLFPSLSVLENLRLAVAARRGTPWNFLTSARRGGPTIDHAEELLARVDIVGDPRRLVRNLSYGEQRQLEIGVALAGDPALLLLDEPTSGMSPAETDRMIALIASLPRTLSILMIEHDMNVVFTLADRITVFYYGEILASGPPDEIRADRRVREVYLGMRH